MDHALEAELDSVMQAAQTRVELDSLRESLAQELIAKATMLMMAEATNVGDDGGFELDDEVDGFDLRVEVIPEGRRPMVGHLSFKVAYLEEDDTND